MIQAFIIAQILIELKAMISYVISVYKVMSDHPTHFYFLFGFLINLQSSKSTS